MLATLWYVQQKEPEYLYSTDVFLEVANEISIPFVGGSLTISLPAGQKLHCCAVGQPLSWFGPWLFSSYLHKHLFMFIHLLDKHAPKTQLLLL